MKTKTILTSIMLVFGMSLFTYAEPVSAGQGSSKSAQQITKDFVNTLTVKKLNCTIKWSKNKWSQTTIIATVKTSVEDLSFIDMKGLSLSKVFTFLGSGGYWNAVNLVKVNKSKTVAKFLSKFDGGKHLVIMKLKKGVLTLIIKNKGDNFADEQLGLTNTATDGWVSKSLDVNVNVSNDGTTIFADGQVSIDYKTKEDKVTKVKIYKVK